MPDTVQVFPRVFIFVPLMALAVFAVFVASFILPALAAGAGPGLTPAESFSFDAERFELENNVYKLFGGANGPAVAYFQDSTLAGLYIEYQPDNQLARVEGQARLKYLPEETSGGKAAGQGKDPVPLMVAADSAVADMRAGRILARGGTQRVRIDYGEVTALSQEATLFTGERRLVLVGQPEVRSGGDLLTAGEITLFLDDGRVVGQGGVHLTIIQEKGREKSPGKSPGKSEKSKEKSGRDRSGSS